MKKQHLAQVRADALAEEQRIAQMRKDWDRERAQAQSPYKGFQRAYVRNPNAHWNMPCPLTRPPSARFGPPFPSTIGFTSALNQAFLNTSRAPLGGRVNSIASTGAANLVRPGGGASTVTVTLATNIGAASAVGVMQTSTATIVDHGLAPDNTTQVLATTTSRNMPPPQPSIAGWNNHRRNRVGTMYLTARNLDVQLQTSTAV